MQCRALSRNKHQCSTVGKVCTVKLLLQYRLRSENLHYKTYTKLYTGFAIQCDQFILGVKTLKNIQYHQTVACCQSWTVCTPDINLKKTNSITYKHCICNSHTSTPSYLSLEISGFFWSAMNLSEINYETACFYSLFTQYSVFILRQRIIHSMPKTANKNLLVWSNSNNCWANASKKTSNAFCFYDMPLTNTVHEIYITMIIYIHSPLLF